MKEFITQLSSELFKTKIEIEKELSYGNKSNEELYLLILKSIEFLKSGRKGEPISKKLPIYKYFYKKYGITNLFLIKLSRGRERFTQTLQRMNLKSYRLFLRSTKLTKNMRKRVDILNIKAT